MKTVRMKRGWLCENLPSPFGRGAGGEGRGKTALTLTLSQWERGLQLCLFTLASFWLASAAVGQDEAKPASSPDKQATLADPPNRQKKQPEKPKDQASEKLRPIRVAIFDVDVLLGIGVEGPAVTDQLNTMLSAMPQVTLVNRNEIKKVADEHQIALSGLVDNSSAVKLGKFLSAQYIVVGRASKIGQTFYLVLRIVDVETTVQTTVSAKATVDRGFETVLERLGEPLTAGIRRLQRPAADSKDSDLAKLRKLAKPLAGKVLLVAIEETHVGRPLQDAAAQMAVVQRLRSLGLSVISPVPPAKPGQEYETWVIRTDDGVSTIVREIPTDNWKESLLQTGKFGDKKVDFLLEGEGTSAFAAQIQGLTSCRARVELRLVSVPGRTIDVSDRGVAAAVDLVEALAAKTALEEAGKQAADAVIRRAASKMQKPKK